MRILLDTNVVLWLLTDDRRLSQEARELLTIPARNVYYSVASLWEISIKHNLGRLPTSPQEACKGMIRSGCSRLPILDEHIYRVTTLPNHHRDPFDRMLVAQADVEPMKLVTSDRFLGQYGDTVLVV